MTLVLSNEYLAKFMIVYGFECTTDYTDFHRLMIYIIDNKIKKSVLIRVICGEMIYPK